MNLITKKRALRLTFHAGLVLSLLFSAFSPVLAASDAGSTTVHSTPAHTETISLTPDALGQLTRVTAGEDGYFEIDGERTDTKIPDFLKNFADYEKNGVFYVGYNGYLFYNREQTDMNIRPLTRTTTAEDTASLYGNPFFADLTLDFSSERILLTNGMNYHRTVYSALTVKTVRVFAAEPGTLTVGKVPLGASADKTLTSGKRFTLAKGENLLDLQFPVSDKETLAFGADGDTAKLLAKKEVASSDTEGCFASLSSPERYGTRDRLLLTAEVEMAESGVTEHLAALFAAAQKETKERMRGMRFSILGDSISTYAGWSNDTSVNPTLGKNATWFSPSRGLSVDETWWKATADDLGLDICVNNSWSGSMVQGGDWGDPPSDVSLAWNRAKQLSTSAGETPDLIVIYLGANDYNRENSTHQGIGHQLGSVDEDFYSRVEAEDYYPKNFAEAYAKMVYTVVKTYADADIYAFGCNASMLPRTVNDPTAYLPFNRVMTEICMHYGVEMIDLANESGIDQTNAEEYMLVEDHPNAKGMRKLADAIERHLMENYTE